MFEKQVKPINTLRFDEFLLSEEKKVQRELELEKQALNEFSFATDASYELMVEGPAIKPPRPDNIPPLTLTGLPEYVTSSEEGDEWEEESEQQQLHTKDDGVTQ